MPGIEATPHDLWNSSIPAEVAASRQKAGGVSAARPPPRRRRRRHLVDLHASAPFLAEGDQDVELAMKHIVFLKPVCENVLLLNGMMVNDPLFRFSFPEFRLSI
jgi:hypothetical protein